MDYPQADGLDAAGGLIKRGLSLNPSKCKAQTNQTEIKHRGLISLSDDFAIEVLPAGHGLELLGTSLSLNDVTGCELKFRIAAGWKKLWALRKLLLNSRFSLKGRLRLFHSTVSGTVLWGTESWTPRAEELRHLQATQNAMLRKIVASRRQPEETYVDWIIRATELATS